MTTPQFIAWLDRKMAEHGVGKLVPPEEVLAAELEERLKSKVPEAITERILREAGCEEQVTTALKAIKRPSGEKLAKGIKELFAREPEREWRNHIEAVASRIKDEGTP